MVVGLNGLFQALEGRLHFGFSFHLKDHQLVVCLGLKKFVEVVTDASETAI